MIKYQRFVAYVYEYRKGKKENNCGFLRVETRDGNVTVEVHMRCPGLPADEKCSIYGFVRNSGLMEGILLGDAWSGEEKLDCLIESDKMDDASWKEEFSKFGGMIIQTENGAFFGTEWDDIPIKPENFDARVMSKISSTNSDNENPSITEPQNITESQTELSISVERKEDVESKPNTYIETNTETKQEKITVSPINIKTEADMGVFVKKEMERNKNDITDSKNNENNKEFVRIQETEMRQGKEQSENKSSAAWSEKHNPDNKQPAFCPFNDDEFTECRKIHPNEFFKSCPRMCALRNNRFLEHGYYNFGHLLVGKRANGQRILGVPGGYDQQERFMANMFGFPYFKESREVQLPGGRGGYWYRLLNPANFH